MVESAIRLKVVRACEIVHKIKSGSQTSSRGCSSSGVSSGMPLQDVSAPSQAAPQPAVGGVTTRTPDSLLVGRARDYLAAGPADSRALVAVVCQLPGVPEAVAEHLARTLVGSHADFVRIPDGRSSM